MVNEQEAGTASPLEKVINETETLNFREIVVTLTFEGFDPWAFVFERQTSAEVKKIRQDYFDLKESERESKTKEYRLNTLSTILKKDPTGLPDYPFDGSMQDKFIQYFSRPENDEYLTWVWNEYQAKLYPKEFMSRLSE
jgi:hypothetical protein